MVNISETLTHTYTHEYKILYYAVYCVYYMVFGARVSTKFELDVRKIDNEPGGKCAEIYCDEDDHAPINVGFGSC